MEHEYEISLAKNVKIFASLTEDEEKLIISSSSDVTFPSGEDISAFTSGRLCVVTIGRADVFSSDNGRSTLLRMIREWDIFGVAGLFSGSEPVSRIVTRAKTRILLIPKESIISLMSRNENFARDYISFLEKRISFLNQRISAFTAGSCERKLALFLCNLSEEESFSIEVSFSSLARQLDMGRASFYRALGILEDDGLVSGNEKKITVLSRNALRSKYV